MSVDPLQLLIEYISTSRPVQKLGEDAVVVTDWQQCRQLGFGDNLFPKDTPTRYKKDAGAYYDLQSLLACYEEREQAVPAYLQFCMTSGVPFISAVDREKVVQILTGQRTEAEEEQIEPRQDAGTDATLKRGATDANTADTGRPAKRAKYVVNKEDQELVKKLIAKHDARQLTDSTKVLRGTKPTDFDYIRQLVADRIKSARDEMKKFDPKHQSQSQSNNLPSRSPSNNSRKRPLNPIIMVSPSSSAMITMHNVKRFLEEAAFETSASRIAQGLKSTDDLIAVYHKRQVGTGGTPSRSGLGSSNTPVPGGSADVGEKLVKYSIVDSVEALSKFGEDAWDRVVCVMTTGQEWQFRPYKWPEPKELFHHGITITWTNDPPNPKIASWNVTELKLDPVKRHIDKSVVAEFWRVLEQWISVNKPWLAW